MSMLEGSEDKMDPFRRIKEGKSSRSFEKVKEELMKKEIENKKDNARNSLKERCRIK